MGAFGLMAVGGVLLYYANDLNKGWTTERLINFCIDFGLSLIPAGGLTFKIGKSILRNPLTGKVIITLINKNSKNITYEITVMKELGIMGTINKGHDTYILFCKSESIFKNAFGFTKEDIIINFAINQIENLIADYLSYKYFN